MRVIEIPDGAHGFDCNATLTTETARAFVAHGYTFVARYLRRATPHAFDLTPDEATAIVASGLGLFAVQHVESADLWDPTPDKGVQFGAVAASEAQHAGLPAGASVACDLEGVAVGTDPEIVIAYLLHWYAPVKAAGFLPVLYVGWHAGLSADALFHRLPFTRYWAAYNLNGDQYPAIRGVCCRQRAVTAALGTPPGIPFGIDADIASADAKGGRLTMVVA